MPEAQQKHSLIGGKLHVYRRQNARNGKPPARSTLHQEMVTLRQILKTALRHGWLSHLPDLSGHYKSSGKVTRRAWFSPEDYRQVAGT